jgi:hypothetical protein
VGDAPAEGCGDLCAGFGVHAEVFTEDHERGLGSGIPGQKSFDCLLISAHAVILFMI